jgi:hypothetical protein
MPLQRSAAHHSALAGRAAARHSLRRRRALRSFVIEPAITGWSATGAATTGGASGAQPQWP